MSANRITWSGATLAALLALVALAGCGGSGSSTTIATEAASTVQEPTSDALVLDKVLARQEAAVDAYAEVIPTLAAPRLARMAAYFRAQEQEHVDATIKALRGLESKAEPEPEPVEAGDLKTDEERLKFLYEVEGATIDEELSAIGKLEATWPRSLLASVVADQAQHRTLLRQALGAGPLASVPEPFENGTAPPPE
jgi:Ferritin-like domain